MHGEGKQTTIIQQIKATQKNGETQIQETLDGVLKEIKKILAGIIQIIKRLKKEIRVEEVEEAKTEVIVIIEEIVVKEETAMIEEKVIEADIAKIKMILLNLDIIMIMEDRIMRVAIQDGKIKMIIEIQQNQYHGEIHHPIMNESAILF